METENGFFSGPASVCVRVMVRQSSDDVCVIYAELRLAGSSRDRQVLVCGRQSPRRQVYSTTATADSQLHLTINAAPASTDALYFMFEFDGLLHQHNRHHHRSLRISTIGITATVQTVRPLCLNFCFQSMSAYKNIPISSKSLRV